MGVASAVMAGLLVSGVTAGRDELVKEFGNAGSRPDSHSMVPAAMAANRK
jgi:hypothetical protein